MKKIVILILSIITCFSLMSCDAIDGNIFDFLAALDGDADSDSGSQDGSEDNSSSGNGGENIQAPAPVFISPVVGTVVKLHSATAPVFSNTLQEWRIHTGLDIMAELGTEVVASSDGEVTGVYNDPTLGMTVEITHGERYKSVYSNLSADGIAVKLGDKVSSGDTVGLIGDTALHEVADAPHLHFEILVDGDSDDPLDHITEESKQESLEIFDNGES